MENPNTEEEFYRKFKWELENLQGLPGDYVFKFIVPNHPKNIVQLYQLFDNLEPAIYEKKSRNETYISITFTVYMLDAESIIRLYKQAAKIQGIIML